MNVLVFDNKEKASEKAFKIIKKALDEKKKVFGLATGETPKELYKLIRASDLDFSQAISINLDEFYGLKATQKQSYHYYMKKYWFDFKPFKESYIPDGENYNLIDEIEKFDKILQKYPRDLQLLGLGVNGHIGFNEPGTDFDLETHLTRLSSTTLDTYQRYFAGMKREPHYAYSMGIKSILEADQIVLMAFGAHKAKAVKDMVEGPVTRKVPASSLQNHKNTTILLDREAARLLYDE